MFFFFIETLELFQLYHIGWRHLRTELKSLRQLEVKIFFKLGRLNIEYLCKICVSVATRGSNLLTKGFEQSSADGLARK